MRHVKWFFLVSLLVLLCLPSLACQTITRDTFGTSLWEENCSFVHDKCCAGKTTSGFVQALYGADKKSCLENYAKDISLGNITINFKTQYDKLAKDESLNFDLARAEACFQFIRSASCDPKSLGSEIEKTCGEVFNGSKTEGQACQSENECVLGLFCLPESSSQNTCQKYAGDGEDCTKAFCDPDKGLVCNTEDKKCKAGKKTGEACANSAECQPSLECQEGKCISTDTTTEICK